MLNVERSLLGRRDRHRSASYAKGFDFPTAVQQVKGDATPAAARASCKEARDHLGMTQGDFAKLIGKNDSTVESWESPNPKRRTDPPTFMQQLFAAFLHAQPPHVWELRRMVARDGAVRTVYWLLRSAFEGPRLKSSLDAAAS